MPRPSTRPPSGGVLLALTMDRDRDAVRSAASAAGLSLRPAPSLSKFLEGLREGRAVVTLLSLTREELDEAIIERIAQQPERGALLLSVAGVSLEGAFLAERVGAMALLREPLDPEELRAHVLSVLEESPTHPLPDQESVTEGAGPQMIGSDPVMAPVFETVARASASASTVLVTGESGTGKEVVARVIHEASARKGRPFVGVNCAAIPDNLLESELFGHERGAFTGAVARRTGRFQRAQGGTLFLDEIGDMSVLLQAKLLRVLEERTLEPVGGDAPIQVDVRIVAATHRDLRERIQAGLFREDLYYRLAVVEIELPPLRQRGDDLVELALHFAARAARQHGRDVRHITEAALSRLASHTWPGNVRELRNVLDRAVLLASGDTLRAGDLRMGAGAPRASARSSSDALGYPVEFSLADVEADHIRRVLDASRGHMGQAAERLGIHRNTLTRKLRDYGLAVTPDDTSP